MRRGWCGACRHMTPSSRRRTTSASGTPPRAPPCSCGRSWPASWGGGAKSRSRAHARGTSRAFIGWASTRRRIRSPSSTRRARATASRPTGGGAALTPGEQTRVSGITGEAGRGRRGVIAGVGTTSPAVAIERAQAARATGADAVLVVAPYYNKPTQAGLTAHFTAVAAAVPGVPVVLYNVPGRTASNIQAPTVLGLARDVENIVGVKEASGDFAQIMAILRDRPQGFRVLSGDDAVTLPLVALGADGIVSVVSNEVPDLMARLSELALQGKWDEARALHYRLLPLMEANFIESNPGPV